MLIYVYTNTFIAENNSQHFVNLVISLFAYRIDLKDSKFQEFANIYVLLQLALFFRSAMFREALAKHLHLPAINKNIRHDKAYVVLSFLSYVLISDLGY